MAKKEHRFEVVHEEGNGLVSMMRQVMVDTETGVQYLFVSYGHAGGLCPLLDKDGKPLTREM